MTVDRYNNLHHRGHPRTRNGRLSWGDFADEVEEGAGAVEAARMWDLLDSLAPSLSKGHRGQNQSISGLFEVGMITIW